MTNFDNKGLSSREYQKFVEDASGNVAVRVVGSSGSTSIDVTSSAVDVSGYVGKPSNSDFVTAYTSGTTITMSSLPTEISSVTGTDITSVEQYSSAGALVQRYTRDDVSMTISNNVLTVSGASFGATDVFVVYTNIPRVTGGLSYVSATSSDRVEEIDPISQHYVTETLASVTNGADETYYYYVDMNGYRKAGFQLTLNGGSGTCTVTVEGSIQDDGTAPASCAYLDITSATFGAANFTASNVLIDNDEKLACFKYVRLKVVASTGDADDADWTIYSKRLY